MVKSNGHSLAVPADVVITDAPAPKPKRRKVKLKRYVVWAINRRTGEPEEIWGFEAEDEKAAAKIFGDTIPVSAKATFREMTK